jgi:hypothetical protein
MCTEPLPPDVYRQIYQYQYRLRNSGSLKNVRKKTGFLFVALYGCKSWSWVLKVQPIFGLCESGFETKRGEKEVRLVVP